MNHLEQNGILKKVFKLKLGGWMLLVNRKWFVSYLGEPPKEGGKITIGYFLNDAGFYEVKYFINREIE